MLLNLPVKIILYLAVVFPICIQADTLQSLDSIEQKAYTYAVEKALMQYDNPQIVVGKLDSRLRLQECDSALEAFSNGGVTLGSQTIGIKCHSASTWTVYVPLKVKLIKPVVVAAKALSANQVLLPADLTIAQRDVAAFNQPYLQRPDRLIGQQLKYPVSMGAAINLQSVRPKKVVRRGDLITLVVETANMEVKMNGTAMSDAAVGQRIRVKNSSSKRVVEGIVESPGVVKLVM